MLTVTFWACALVAVTVALHAGGLAVLIKAAAATRARMPSGFWPITWLLVRLTWALLLIHGAEIALWALFYAWSGCLPDAESAFYFSGVTYAPIGYGDLLLPQPWRMLGPVEGLTGILMCGLSTAFFFAFFVKIVETRRGTETR